MSISINSSTLNTQPSTLTEEYLQMQTDQEAIDGSITRNRVGQKKQATMVFPILSPADFQTLFNKFTTGSGVYYFNDASKYGTFAFSGLPSFTEDVYVPGASLYTPLTVKIREQ